jgi:hypothetical protein
LEPSPESPSEPPLYPVKKKNTHTHTHTHTKHAQTHLFPKEKANTLFFYKSVKEEKTQVPNTLYIFSFCFQNSFTKGKELGTPC